MGRLARHEQAAAGCTGLLLGAHTLTQETCAATKLRPRAMVFGGCELVTACLARPLSALRSSVMCVSAPHAAKASIGRSSWRYAVALVAVFACSVYRHSLLGAPYAP